MRHFRVQKLKSGDVTKKRKRSSCVHIQKQKKKVKCIKK